MQEMDVLYVSMFYSASYFGVQYLSVVWKKQVACSDGDSVMR